MCLNPKNLRATAFFSVALLCAQNALAQEGTTPNQSQKFAGPYVGFGVGVGGGTVHQSVRSPGFDFPLQEYGVFGPSGYLTAGFDMPLGGHLILGVQGQYVNLNEDFDFLRPGVQFNELENIRSFNYGLRLGTILNDRQLWYVSGGKSQTTYRFRPTEVDFDGYYYGLGVETRLSKSVSVVLEGRREEFEEMPAFSSGGFTWYEKPSHLRLTTGLKFRLGEGMDATAISSSSTHDWAGGYVSGGLEIASLTSYLHRPPSGVDSQDYGAIGNGGFVQAGYDFQNGTPFVAGIFGDYTFSDITAEDRARETLVGLGNSIAVGGRLGVAFNSNALLFMSAGHVWTEIKAGNDSGEIVSHLSTGWFGGIGAETKLYQNLFLKTEYRVAYIENQRFDFSAGQPTYSTADTHVHSFRLGLSYRF